MDLVLVSFDFDMGCLISLQFRHNTLSSSLARLGSEMYLPHDADPPRPIMSEDTSSDTLLIPKALSSLNPQLEQIFPPKISNNFSFREA